MPRLRFPAKERLKSKKQIAKLFRSGHNVAAFPVLALYEVTCDTVPAKAAFTVSAKNFKSAVLRNRIKRKMREAWRLNKHRLTQEMPSGQCVQIIIIFIGKEVLPYKDIEAGIKRIIKKILKNTETN